MHLFYFAIFQKEMSTVIRLYLVCPLNWSSISKVLVIMVCPGSMKMRMCIIIREDTVLGSKYPGIILFLHFVYTGFVGAQ